MPSIYIYEKVLSLKRDCMEAQRRIELTGSEADKTGLRKKKCNLNCNVNYPKHMFQYYDPKKQSVVIFNSRKTI